MIAIDTNVLVRALTGDDAEQTAKSRKILARPDVWVPLTVSLETEWVLRSLYKIGRSEMAAAFQTMLAYPNLKFEARRQVAAAVRDMEKGMDFADALHLRGLPSTVETFASFDRTLGRKWKGKGLPVLHP